MLHRVQRGRKGGEGTHSVVVVLTKAQEFARKFETRFTLVSYLTSSTLTMGVWLLDNGEPQDT